MDGDWSEEWLRVDVMMVMVMVMASTELDFDLCLYNRASSAFIV